MNQVEMQVGFRHVGAVLFQVEQAELAGVRGDEVTLQIRWVQLVQLRGDVDWSRGVDWIEGRCKHIGSMGPESMGLSRSKKYTRRSQARQAGSTRMKRAGPAQNPNSGAHDQTDIRARKRKRKRKKSRHSCRDICTDHQYSIPAKRHVQFTGRSSHNQTLTLLFESRISYP